MQTLAVLAACVMGLAAADEDAEAAGEPERRLLHTTPALRVLVMRKPQAVQVRLLRGCAQHHVMLDWISSCTRLVAWRSSL